MDPLKYALLIGLISFVFCEDTEVVTIKNGKIRGRVVTTKYNTTFYSFQQIPFAEPPVGNLRFEPPVPKKDWDGILDCQNNTKICMQISRNSELETEDCLYINVYTPVKPGSSEKLPVLYYIYGGGFIFGNGIFNTNGPHYFMDNQIVLVTVGYRLGAFGFISTEDKILPGNNGLRDQRLGLKWVQDNIETFGGDPQKVTIMGQSAGAASVTYQMMNDGSRGHFRAAIGQSGSMMCPWAATINPSVIAFELGNHLNFSGNTSHELKEFLRQKSAVEIKKTSETLTETYTDDIFLPVVEVDHEDAFISKPMYTALLNGEVNHVPLLIGIVSEERISKLSDGIEAFTNELKTYDNDLSLLVPYNMRINDTNLKQEIGKQIKEIYTNETLEEYVQAGVKYFSDRDFNKAVMRFAEVESNFTDVYFYKFSYSGPLGHNDIIKLPGIGKVIHSEDNYYIWVPNGNDTDIYQYPDTDRVISELYVKMFADFTKNPNLETFVNGVTWPKFANGTFPYLNIDEKLEIKHHPFGASYEKWISLYDEYAKKPMYTF
ncbi:esterase FE4-like isoform X2 [Aethina tumida]|uniref:esterase FE4-like isoform X2 n=1 Tax=Aethina tumida TaxID=116153 RepID=UPI0021481AE5|nr:esterase FE4-like isoform X2 [Aethina tumida]